MAKTSKAPSAPSAPSTQCYVLESSEAVHAPGLLKWAMRSRAPDWNKDVRDEACRLWFLADAFPTAPAGVLFDLVKGEIVAETVGATVVLKEKETNK